MPIQREGLKMVAMAIAGLIAMWCSFVMGWCSIAKIYIDVPMLLVLSNIVTGIASCITTVLVGRTMAQLNQPSSENSETTMTQTTQTTVKPKPTELPTDLVVTEQPKVEIASEVNKKTES